MAQGRVVVSGASGFVGSALCPALREAGYDVVQLVRREPAADYERQWDPAAGKVTVSDLAGARAVVNLNGVGIGDGRWTEERRRLIRSSRVDSTATLARAMTVADPAPACFVSVSAVGIYGGRGDRMLSEEDRPGEGFLAEVGVEWEGAADPARNAGIRVIHPRMGIVLGSGGGLLQQLLPPFRLGLGGPVGDGEQYMSWITLTDAVRGLVHLLESDIEGPVNVVAPSPVTNREFTRTLGRVLHRPAIVPLPAFVVKLLFGQMGRELLLQGQRVSCARLQSTGYRHSRGQLEPALEAIVG